MRLRDKVCVGLAGIALLASVVVVGGVLRWTQAIVGLLVGAALLIQLFARRAVARVSPLVLLLGVAVALTALQLVPLPQSILEVLNPVGTHLREDGAALVGTSPWSSISLDPPATLGRLAYFTILTGLAVLALRFSASERGRFNLLVGVALVCGVAAAIAGVHVLSQARTLYGLYEPQYMRDLPILGPLLNPNHLGCLCAMGAVLSACLSFHPHQATQLRLLLIVVAVGCTVAVAASLSRGAIIGLAIGLAVALVLLVAGKTTSGKKRRLRHDLPVALVVAIGLAIGLYFSAGDVANEISRTSVSELDRPSTKFMAWKASMALVKESPWFGIGRGATEATFSRVYPDSAHATYAHLENEYVTTVVEWGVIGTLAIGAALVLCVLAAIRRRRDGPLAAGAIGALCVVIFQSTVDYGIELMGIAAPVIVIAATIQLVPLRPAPSPRRAFFVRLGLAVSVLLSSVLLVTSATRTVREDQKLVVEERAPETIAEAIERHPVDYFAFGIAAEQAWRANDPRAVQLLNHALVLHPTHPGLHRLAARMLVRARQFRQAGVEYAFVLRAEVAPRELLKEIIAVMPTVEDAASAIPTDYRYPDVMTNTLTELRRHDIAIRWMLNVANQAHHDIRLIDKLYNLAVKQNDLDAAKEAAELRRRVARTTTSKVMLARVLLKRGDHDRLLAEFADVRDWTGRIDEKAEAWLIVCDARMAKKQWDEAMECLHRLDGSGLMSATRSNIEKRLYIIKQERNAISKREAIEAMERDIRERDERRRKGQQLTP